MGLFQDIEGFKWELQRLSCGFGAFKHNFHGLSEEFLMIFNNKNHFFFKALDSFRVKFTKRPVYVCCCCCLNVQLYHLCECTEQYAPSHCCRARHMHTYTHKHTYINVAIKTTKHLFGAQNCSTLLYNAPFSL